MRNIIALTGLKGSGKDTTADYIIKNYENWEKDSFAGTLKDAVSVIFGWDRKMLAGETPEDRIIRETPDEYWTSKLGFEVTPRNILQKFGTDCLRNHFHPDIWVNSLEKKIRNSDKNIIITDCRFKNEIDTLKNLGATFIRIEWNKPEWFDKVKELNLKNYNIQGIKNLIPEVKDVHISELDWIGYDKPDFLLYGNNNLSVLYGQIDCIMKEITRNHFNLEDTLKDIKTILDKLLSSKPELDSWARKNFGKYMKETNNAQ